MKIYQQEIKDEVNNNIDRLYYGDWSEFEQERLLDGIK